MRSRGRLQQANPAGSASGVRDRDEAHERRTRGRNGLRRDKFRVPLLETVYVLGGEATLGRTREIMEKKVRAQLDASDYKKAHRRASVVERHQMVAESSRRAGSLPQRFQAWRVAVDGCGREGRGKRKKPLITAQWEWRDARRLATAAAGPSWRGGVPCVDRGAIAELRRAGTRVSPLQPDSASAA